MKNESITAGGLATIILAASVLAAAIVPLAILTDDAGADGAADPDTFYRYTINFQSTSTGAKYVSWDFGDGTPVLDGRVQYYIDLANTGGSLTEEQQALVSGYEALLNANGGSIWAPVHTYAAMGDYTVTITAYNPYGYVNAAGETYDGVTVKDYTGYNGYNGGSSDTATTPCHIRGYPTIAFESNGGSPVGTVTVENTNVYTAATAPADPVRNGYRFAGWYTDAACTESYDWSSLVTKPMTLYAGWTSSAAPVTFTVTYIVGSESIGTEIVTAGDRISSPPGATDGHYVWYTDAACTQEFDADSAIVADTVLYGVLVTSESSVADLVDDAKEMLTQNWIIILAVAAVLATVGLVTWHPSFIGIAAVLAIVEAIIKFEVI